MGDYFPDYFQKIEETKKWFDKNIKRSPKLAIVLTGGVDGPVDEFKDVKEVNAKDIPNFPTARAEGHSGKLIFGKLNNKEIVVLKGRYHYYEGHLAQNVVFPYFVLHSIGVKDLITTNAVGGIRNDLNAGDIVMVTDHINMMGQNPLRGIAIQRNHDQFTSMTDAYSAELQKIAEDEALKNKIDLKKGVYLAMQGPSYETKSEIKMARTFGADFVGMSTVFEVIACNFLGIRVLAFSCIANAAADRHEGKMSHSEVLNAMNAAGAKVSKLVSSCAKRIIS